MKFVTICPWAKNVDLKKDVGMIPYILHKNYGFESYILSYKNEKKYPYLESEVQGLKMHFLEGKNNDKDETAIRKEIINYLRKNAKSIDCLQLYHFNKAVFTYGVMYKLLNPKGFLYLKLDATVVFLKKTIDFLSKKGFKATNADNVKKWYLSKIDLITCENKKTYDYLMEHCKDLKIHLKLLPNGIDIEDMKDKGFKDVKYDEKENIILTVGRLGTYQKATELILNSFAKVNNNNWKLVLIGPIEISFNDFIKNYFIKYPQLKDKVTFTGNILEKKQLYQYYNKSKIFCLSSRYEGFPLVFLEALYFGNYIVTTNFDAAYDATDNGRIGEISEIDNEEEFINNLDHAMSEEKNIRDKFNKCRELCIEKYDWNVICESIYKYILR